MMYIEKRFDHIYLFPAVFVYCEILLRIFGETNVLLNLIYPVLFGVGTGLLFSCITSVFDSKINNIVSQIGLCMDSMVRLSGK